MRGVNKVGHFRIRYGRIYLPHMDYSVIVKRFDETVDGIRPTTVAFARDTEAGKVELFFKQWVSPPTVAHEVTHAVQFICRRRGINMIEEIEHVAYMVDFMMAKVLGYRPETDTRR